MNKREQKVFLMLKPRVKALGFNQKELKGIAAKIASNLTSEEDASEEELTAEIETQIEAVMPFLQVAQSQSNRLLEEWRKKNQVPDDVGDDADDEPASPKKSKGANKSTQQNEGNEQMKQLMDMVAKLTGEISSLKQEKTTDSRKSRLEKLLKDSGTFGTRTLKNFAKMSFESDDEFDEFYSDVENDLKAYVQERADAGLDVVTPPSTIVRKPEKSEEPYSDDEIAAMADVM